MKEVSFQTHYQVVASKKEIQGWGAQHFLGVSVFPLV